MVVQRISGSTVSAALTSSQRRSVRTAKPPVKTEDTTTPLELSTPTKQSLKLEVIEESASFTTPKRKRATSTSSSRPKTSRKRQKKAADAEDDFPPQTPTQASSSKNRTKPLSSRAPKKGGKKTTSTPKTAKTLSEKEPRRRRAKDVKYGNRCWLYQTELLNWHKYNFGISDLAALPATVKQNSRRPSTNTYCYRVYHLNWLKSQLDAGKGLILPAGSTVNPEHPEFVLENGPAMSREKAKSHYHRFGLNSDQLNRLKPCKKASLPDGKRAVEQWNVCDIEALLQQGQNLEEHCPPAPEPLRAIPVYIEYDEVDFDYYDEDFVEEQECPCCVFFGLPG